MKIGQKVRGYTVTAILPDVRKPGSYVILGYRPGNKRPTYATWQVSRPGIACVIPIPQRFEVFSDSGKTAKDRYREAVTSLLLRSGTYEVADDFMKAFFAAMTEGVPR